VLLSVYIYIYIPGRGVFKPRVSFFALFTLELHPALSGNLKCTKYYGNICVPCVVYPIYIAVKS